MAVSVFSLYLSGNGKTTAGFLSYHHRSLQCLPIPQPQGQDSVQDSSTQLVPAAGGLSIYWRLQQETSGAGEYGKWVLGRSLWTVMATKITADPLRLSSAGPAYPQVNS